MFPVSEATLNLNFITSDFGANYAVINLVPQRPEFWNNNFFAPKGTLFGTTFLLLKIVPNIRVYET